jgi:hypothetical protein
MDTDELLVFEKMLRLGRPAKAAEVAEGLQRWGGPIYGLQPVSLQAVKGALSRLARAGACARPTKTTYAATWGALPEGTPRPALHLMPPALERVAGAFGGDSVTVHFDGFVYRHPSTPTISRADGGAVVGDVAAVPGGWVVRSHLHLADLSVLRAKSGASAYFLALHALRAAVAAAGPGWSLSAEEKPAPKCPNCSEPYERYGYQSCCGRTVIVRDDGAPFVTGCVEAPVDLAEVDPSRERPLSLWSVAERLDTLRALVRS